MDRQYKKLLKNMINGNYIYGKTPQLKVHYGSTGTTSPNFVLKDMDIQSLYPSFMLGTDTIPKKFDKPLTKQQLFDLQFKWDVMLTNEWSTISKITEYWDNPYFWYRVSIYKKLSEEFIREYEDRVNWFCISVAQNLSEEFIREFKNRLNLDSFLKSNTNRFNLPIEFLVEVECWVKGIEYKPNRQYGYSTEFTYCDESGR